MARAINVSVLFQDGLYFAAVDPDERGDQLLLRSLYHFGIDPAEKTRYRLKPRAAGRDDRAIVLDDPIGRQLRSGAELVLEEDVAGNRPLSTGSY